MVVRTVRLELTLAGLSDQCLFRLGYARTKHRGMVEAVRFELTLDRV